MLKVENNKFVFTSCQITFKDNGEDRLIYTDSPSIYESMINSDTKFTDYKLSPIVPTKEEQARLAEINKVKLDNKDGFVDQASLFVKYSYVSQRLPEQFKKLKTKYETQTKEYILSDYKKQLSDYKTTRADGGAMFMGNEIKTDNESKLLINGQVTTLGLIDIPTINFKAANGVWLTLTKQEFILLSLTVSGHISACFEAESRAIKYLGDLSLEELEALEGDGAQTSPEGQEDAFSIEKLFEQFYGPIMDATNKSLLAQVQQGSK